MMRSVATVRAKPRYTTHCKNMSAMRCGGRIENGSRSLVQILERSPTGSLDDQVGPLVF